MCSHAFLYPPYERTFCCSWHSGFCEHLLFHQIFCCVFLPMLNIDYVLCFFNVLLILCVVLFMYGSQTICSFFFLLHVSCVLYRFVFYITPILCIIPFWSTCFCYIGKKDKSIYKSFQNRF